MNQKRPLTLTAGIMNIVAFSIYALLTLYIGYVTFILIALAVDLSGSTDATFTATLIQLIFNIILRIALTVTSIILSAKIIKLRKANVETYSEKKSLIVGVAVINIIVVAYGIFSYLTAGISNDALIISIVEILMFVVMLVVSILLLVDVNKNKKIVQEAQAQIIADTVSAPEQSQPVQSEEPSSETETKLDELEKLNKMKADGLISDEEYEKMKADIIK